MLIMEKLLHLFQPCLFLLMMMHGTLTLEHQCTFHTNRSGSRILMIYLKDNSIQEAIARRKMMASLKLRDTTTLAYFNNILYAPRLAKKHFSARQVVSMGHTTKFTRLCCVIKN